MRFRGKFHWLQAATSALWIGLSCAWIHKSSAPPSLRVTYLITGILQLCALLFYLSTYFTWWDIGKDELVQRRLWGVRRIPWDQIARVGPWRLSKKPRYTWIEVDYVRPSPLSDQGTLLMQPEDREALISALRSHAPQAEFEF